MVDSFSLGGREAGGAACARGGGYWGSGIGYRGAVSYFERQLFAVALCGKKDGGNRVPSVLLLVKLFEG